MGEEIRNEEPTEEIMNEEPTEEEVLDFARHANIGIEAAEDFWTYFTAMGWDRLPDDKPETWQAALWGWNTHIAYELDCRSIFNAVVEAGRNACEKHEHSDIPTVFCDYYEERDWMINGGQMADWKAAARMWCTHIDRMASVLKATGK